MADGVSEVRLFERTALVSDREIDDFRRDGFVRIRSVLTNDEVEGLRAAVDRQFANRAASPTGYDFQDLARQYWREREGAAHGGALEGGAATRFNLGRVREAIDADADARALFDGPPSDRGAFFYDVAGWRTHKEIRAVALDSRLPEACWRLMGGDYVNFWEDTTFVKTPGANLRTPFHQDYTYFQISGRRCCIAWIALDVADAENGAMQYVAGSHLWGKEFKPNLFISQTPIPGGLGERLADIEACLGDYDIRVVPAEPGDVIFHDVMTVHGSSGNVSEGRMRRGISLRYCGDDIRYRSKPGAVPQPWIENPPEEGAPLYSRFYPRVWPRPFPEARLSLLYPDGV